MEAAAEHGAALKSVFAPTGHADSLALVERGGSWSPQQRLKRARADSSASGSASQETHSPGASHATTASAARVEPLAGVTLGDTAGDNGEGALFTLSAVCHDALHADEANAAGWKGCAVKEGTAPAEQDSASSQALAFSMWGTGAMDAPGPRSTRPSGDTSPQAQQQVRTQNSNAEWVHLAALVFVMGLGQWRRCCNEVFAQPSAPPPEQPAPHHPGVILENLDTLKTFGSI